MILLLLEQDFFLPLSQYEMFIFAYGVFIF